ncbi:hypothetical protein TNCV_3163441 [Trichonephila clavipes]|nr:hypothetical protein TNCV_3163441 [Trichonephila clavipes]
MVNVIRSGTFCVQKVNLDRIVLNGRRHPKWRCGITVRKNEEYYRNWTCQHKIDDICGRDFKYVDGLV